MMEELFDLRGSERARFKRCIKAWYWEWRRGLVPRAARFGALEFGTWMHAALAHWYGRGLQRRGDLIELFSTIALADIHAAEAKNAPDRVIEEAHGLLALGKELAAAYVEEYDTDSGLWIVATEVPLSFTIPAFNGVPKVRYKFKPDAVFLDKNQRLWLLETKTVKTIRTDHLSIDDQARPYIAMAERAIGKSSIMKPGEPFEFQGMLYNFLRKGLPDLRPKDTQGRSLNKDGSVSKTQPAKMFDRHPVKLTRRAKIIALRRAQQDALAIREARELLQSKQVKPSNLPKTSHWSCPKHCQFWAMCKVEEEGGNIRGMEKDLYFRRNPYSYDEKHQSTDEISTFEMGF